MMETLFFKTTQKVALVIFFALMSVGAFAQVSITDTVCADTQDKVYGIMNPTAGSTFDWILSDPSAGTIDYVSSPVDSVIEIDWGSTPGTYTLYAVETTADGCLGDTVELDIIINELPTVLIATGPVCADSSATLTFDFTGAAPWYVEYTDGTTVFTDSVSTSPFTASLPGYQVDQQIDVTLVTDANTCDADVLPSTTVTVYPAPSSGGIYRY